MERVATENPELFGNLSGANLYGADLSGAGLFRAFLSGTNLKEANLEGADLQTQRSAPNRKEMATVIKLSEQEHFAVEVNNRASSDKIGVVLRCLSTKFCWRL
jgi:Pentapeptide repeats (8 copies)